MKKLILSAVLALSVSSIVTAQIPEFPGARQLPNGLIEVPLESNGPRRIYDFGDDVTQNHPYSSTGGITWGGDNGYYTNTFAVLVDRPEWKGYTLMGLGTNYVCKDGLKSMSLWTSSKLWEDAPDGEILTQYGANKGYYALHLKKPVTLDGSKFYVGLSYEIDSAYVAKFQADHPQVARNAFNVIGVLPSNFVPNTCIHRDKDGKWTDETDIRGSLNYFCYLKAPAEAPALAATVGQPKSALGVVGKEIVLGVPVTGGSDNVRSLTFEVTFQGKTTTATEDMVKYYSDISNMGTVQFLVKLPAVDQPGKYPVTFKVTKVGNQNNTVIDNPAKVSEVTFDVEIREKATPQLPQGVVESRLSNGQNISYFGFGTYYSGNSALSGALKIDDPALVGMKIVGAKISNLKNADNGNYCLWLSSKLEGDDPDGERVYGIRDGSEMTVLFENPVELPAEGLYVGATIDILKCTDATKACFPVTGPKGLSEALWFNQHSNKKGWTDFSSEGAVPITVYLQGDLPDNSMDLGPQSGNVTYAKNVPFTLHFEASNAGCKEVKSINYTYQFGEGLHEGELTFDTPLPTGLGAKYTVDIPLEGINYEGEVEGTLTIDLVNGKKNQSKKKMQTLKLRFVPCLPVKRPLFEEGTGVECGYCPRGMIAIHTMKQRHPDFIAAAYHGYNKEDGMYFGGAMPWGNNANDKGFPKASIDRNPTSIDPYFGSYSTTLGVEKDWLSALEYAAPASLEMETAWDADKHNLTINTTAKFYFTEPVTYQIGYLLIADSLSHPDDDMWQQINYFAGKTASDSLLAQLANGEFDVNMFNDVVTTTAEYGGIAKSVPADVKAGDVVKNTYSYDITKIPLAENPDHLRVIAFLRDKNNKVYNAREVKAGENTVPDPEPVVVEKNVVINEVSENNVEVQYYDLMGRRVANPQHGIFIKLVGNKAVKIVK